MADRTAAAFGQALAGKVDKAPMRLWHKYGLAAPGWFRALEAEPRYAGLPRAARLRLALEENGGLFLHFGRFLAGRADLLPSAYLSELRKIRMPAPAASSPPDGLKQLVPDLQILRTAPGLRIFSGSYADRPVVVEVADGTDDAARRREWDWFERRARRLNDEPEDVISRPLVLQQFHDWLRLRGNLEQKRTMLSNLQDIIPDTVSGFPKMIPALQSPAWMGYEAMEGEPVDQLLARPGGKEEALHVLAEGFLEQCLLFSLVDSEFQMDELLVLEKGRLGFRTLPSWAAVPVESHQDLLQYLVSAVAGDTPRAVRMLCRISAGRHSYAAEQRLLNELSSLQPELKINAVTPESVTALETYSRALQNSDINPPLFLRLFHRNITLIGQYNEQFTPSVDMIDQALWPVLGRLLRFHIAEVLSSGRVQEWALSSALFVLTTGRQVATTLEKLRENDPRITPEPDIRAYDSPDAQSNRRTFSLIRSAIVLVVFLFSLQASMSSGGDFLPLITGIIAVVSAIGLCFSVAGIR